MRGRTRRYLVLALVIGVLTFGGALTVGAQAPYYRQQVRPDRLTQQAYERMRQLAQRLDQLATNANQQARRDQFGLARQDRAFLNSIDRFARRAAMFHNRMENYQTQPWKVDDELNVLLREARQVQNRIVRADLSDEYAYGDWDRVVAVLGQMIRTYRSGLVSGVSGTTGTTGGTAAHPIDSEQYGAVTDVRLLARELEYHTGRAADMMANSSLSVGPAIEHLATQARDFNDRVRTSQMRQGELQNYVAHLLEDAQTAQNELNRLGAPTELRQEWRLVVDDLRRLRQVAGVDTGFQDRLPSQSNMAQLARDLEQRVSAASDMARREGVGNTTVSAMVRLNTEARTFRESVERGGFRGADQQQDLNRMLSEARTIRDELDRRFASNELIADWDDVIRVMARMDQLA